MDSVVLKVRFPLGRYHGTTWLRGHNEGVVDWPPAPWRVLRAFVAIWKSRLEPIRDPQNSVQDSEKNGIQEGTFFALLDALKTPPAYHAPWATLARTGHFVPRTVVEKKSGLVKPDLLYDTFAAFDPDESLYIKWDVDWPDDEKRREALSALSEIAERLPYLGRTESICEARLLGDGEYLPEQGWLKPSSNGAIELPRDIPVLGMVPQKLLAPIESVPGKDLLEYLLVSVDKIQGERKFLPPNGARWVWYPLAVVSQRRARRSGPAVLVDSGLGSAGAGGNGGRVAWRCHRPVVDQDAPRKNDATARRPSISSGESVETVSEVEERPIEPFAVRWGIVSGVPTSLKLAVLIADAMHRAAARTLHDRGITASPYVLGKVGEETMEGHRHVHWIALPESRNGKLIRSVVAYSRCRLTDEELLALEKIDLISAYSGSHQLAWVVRLATYGEPKDVVPELVGPARRWESLTPYASPTLSLDRDACRGHIKRDLEDLGLPKAGLVEAVDGVHRIAWSEFRRYRGGQRLDRALPAAGYRIDFGEESEVSGPLVLGRLRHFGLGVFWPADDKVGGERVVEMAG